MCIQSSIHDLWKLGLWSHKSRIELRKHIIYYIYFRAHTWLILQFAFAYATLLQYRIYICTYYHAFILQIRIMPTKMTNETAVRVYIHHSPDHHCGICPSNGCDVSLVHLM